MNKDDKVVLSFAILMIIFLVFVFIPSHAMADSFRAPDGASCQFDSDDSDAEIEINCGNGDWDFGHEGDDD